MPISVTMPDGTVQDVSYRRFVHLPQRYYAYLGTELLGQLDTDHKSWTVVIMNDKFDAPETFRLVEGFHTRYDGVAYILRAIGYWNH